MNFTQKQTALLSSEAIHLNPLRFLHAFKYSVDGFSQHGYIIDLLHPDTCWPYAEVIMRQHGSHAQGVQPRYVGTSTANRVRRTSGCFSDSLELEDHPSLDEPVLNVCIVPKCSVFFDLFYGS